MTQVNPKALAGVLSGAALIAATFFMPFEGDHPKPYYDPPHVATDCYGHTKGVKITDKPTHQDCLVYLGQDTNAAALAVKRDVKVKVSDRTAAAFISFTFNLGAGEFRKSSVLRDANAGNIEAACNDIDKCVEDNNTGKFVGYGCGWSGGVRLKGLEDRREGEKQLCLSGL